MSKKEDVTDEIDFDFIFSKLENIQTIENQIAKLKRRNQTIVAVCIILLLSFVAIHLQILENKRDFIEGNVLKIAFTNAPDRNEALVNPWKNASFLEEVIYRSLFITDSSFTTISPELAKSYSVSDDGLTYTITLKEGLKWSDGEELTVEDIVFSIEAFLLADDVNPNLSLAFRKIIGYEDYVSGKIAYLTGISTSGNNITIKLDSNYSSFMLLLTQFVPLPKHIWENVDPIDITDNHYLFGVDDIVCSGMYYPEDISRSGNLILVQNPYYEGQKSEILQIIAYDDSENVELDYFATNDITQMVTFRGLNNYSEFPVDVYYYRYFCYNIQNSDHVDDLRVRQAINHAIDIQQLFKSLYLDSGNLIYSGIVNATSQLYDYNPEKSKQLLEEANFDFEKPYVIGYYYNDMNSRIFLEKVASYLEEVGMTVELIHLNSSELFDNPKYDMLLKELSAFNSEEWYNEYLTTNSYMSEIFGDECIFDSLVDDLVSTTSTNEYYSILNQLIEIEQDILYKLPLFTLNQCVYINTNRISLPADMTFGNVHYRSDMRLSSWSIKKS